MAKKINDVYSFLIPMLEEHLLIPNETVAEIVPFMNVSLFEEVESNTEKHIGNLLWRNVKVPVISLERVQGQQNIGDIKRSRIAILYTLNGNQKIPYIAISVQGIPRLVPIDKDNSEFAESSSNQDGILAWVSVSNKKALIPDIDYLESLVS